MPVSTPFNVLSGGDSQTTPSGGTVVGTTGITVGQVAYGDTTANTIKGEAAFAYNESTDTLTAGSLTMVDTTSATTGVILKGASRFAHNFHNPTGGGAVPTGQNLFVGILAGNFTTGSTATVTDEASYNTGLGYSALTALTTGYQNTAVGNSAGLGVTTGQGNTLVGYGAGQSILGGNHNVGIGGNSCLLVSTGSYNIGIGTDTVRAVTTASANIGIGYDALHNTTGGSNTAIGYLAMLSNAAGSENTALGHGSGYATSGSGVANTTGTLNTWIGAEANGTANNLTNATALGAGARVGASNTIRLGNDSILGAVIGPATTLPATGTKFYVYETTDARSSEIRIGHGSNNNATNHARVHLRTGGTTSGDPYIIFTDTNASWSFGADTSDSEKVKLVLSDTLDGANPILTADKNGNVVISGAALATTATNGFMYVPSCAGTPTGVPTAYSGRVPVIVDTTNNKLYFYSTGAWRDAGP